MSCTLTAFKIEGNTRPTETNMLQCKQLQARKNGQCKHTKAIWDAGELQDEMLPQEIVKAQITVAEERRLERHK